ncbi:TPA: hypothetical protein DEO28_00575 [Candidatus Dependentiae bacterium]|nr:MAG: hypothetical protein UR14_C0001G0034 [candidate division TM6 bacterium GW2011_GWE2_31_21]KKP54086.1 MAG: hypothetical protein UR43_C0001G0104 [candidate division TM6 bacterium GW2011_GWF2_33_332]HBS48332.1 hypothetical protein [Candidatus Dependentiae bacterium]HBZ72994.1 hypothetical protein [Candidatus Dependentiae bacterium]
MLDATKNIENLREQTSFLLEKQEDLYSFCKERFEELLSIVKAKVVESETDKNQVEKLNSISKVLGEHSQKVLGEIESDVSFLKEQLEVIEEVESGNDLAKKEELISAMMENEELLEMEEFREDVLQEVEDSKKGFDTVVEDLISALEEGNLDEVLVYLQEMEDHEEKESGCCGGECHSGCEDCSSCDDE